MRWIKKVPSCCQMVCPGEKESSANMLIKRIARIQKIRGNQLNNLIDVFILSPLFWRTRAGKFYNNFISYSLVSRDAHTAGNPPSSICSPLSLPKEGGASAGDCPQPNPYNLIWLQLIRSDYQVRFLKGCHSKGATDHNLTTGVKTETLLVRS